MKKVVKPAKARKSVPQARKEQKAASKTRSKAKKNTAEGIDNTGLTPQQQVFADYYIQTSNGTKAVYRAGFDPKNDNVAAVTAVRLLRNSKVQAYIEARKKAISDKLAITDERILQEVARIAFFDVRKLYDDHGNLRPVHTLDDDTAAGVAGIKVVETDDSVMVDDGEGPGLMTVHTKEVKAVDKGAALDKLMRHRGLYKPEEVTINHTFESKLLNARKRAAEARSRRRAD